MVSKTQPVIPPPPPPPPPPIHLETIYEESGSSLSSSIVDARHQPNNRQTSSTYSTNQTIHGLISARSIPSVDVHRRRRTNKQNEKPPIEVRYRDGTKGYIYQSLATTSMIMNRRKYSSSSRHDSSLSSSTTTTTKTNLKYRQILNTTPKKKKKLSKKSEIRLTIITAEDLSQAGITPPSTSSPDESETLALAKSQSNSSLDTIQTVNDVSLKDTIEVPIERLRIATVPPSIHSVEPVIDVSILNLHFPPPPTPPRHRSQHPPQLRHPQQIPTVRSQSLPPSSQSHFLHSSQQKPISNQIPPVAVVPPSPKKIVPSLQITLTKDENANEKNRSSKGKHSNTKTSSSKCNNETTNSEYKYSFRPSATVLVGGGSRSAFRPFHKSTNLNSQPQISSNNNIKSRLPTNQSTHKSSSRQQPPIILPSHSNFQPYQSSSLSKATGFTLQPSISTTTNPVVRNRRSMSSDSSKKPVNTLISNQISSDKIINSTSKSFQKPTNNREQSTFISTNNSNSIDHSFNKPKEQISNVKSPSITVDSTLQWHSVTSKSLYDVPRLSNQYSDIPLRITIPDGTPTHNQKLLHKHDPALEKRLLDAGLSPETIALYERILEVADVDQLDILSPPEIIDQYQPRSIL